MDIRPIKTEHDYRAALYEIEQLMDAAPNSAEEDKLDVLAILVQAYEERHYPIPPPDPIAALTYYMESRGISRRQLEEYIGGRGRVTEILGRKRALTLNMIRRLHTGLGVPAHVLIQSYSLDSTHSAHLDRAEVTIKKTSPR